MAAQTLQECCTTGFKHSGTPSGKIIDFHGIETYIAGKEIKNGKVLLFFSDVLGHKFINSQLVADQFAAAGYLTIVPDLFEKDPIPLNPGPEFAREKWFEKHSPAAIEKIADLVCSHVVSDFVPKYLVSVGYCYGAKFSVQLLDKGKVQAVAANHPSFVSEEEFKNIKGPLLITAAQTDNIFSQKNRYETENILNKTDQRYQICLFSAVSHGFTVRGNPNVSSERYGREQAFLQNLAWFNEFAP